MTKRQQKAAREYRRKHRKQYVAYSKAWKARNPDWWKGRKYIQLLTSALINNNSDSVVFKQAGLTWDEWLCGLPVVILTSGSTIGVSLANGSKLVPFKSWREFDQKSPDRVRQFLAPGNFKLVSK